VVAGDDGYDELVDGSSGNYLKVMATPTDGKGQATVWRDCTGPLGIDLTQAYSIDFLYRIDESAADIAANFATANDRYQIHDSPNTYTNGETGFWIGAHGNDDDTPWVADEDVGYWCFFDGQKDGSLGRDYRGQGGLDETYWVNTGFQLASGTTYSFHIDIDPINYEYSATISSDNAGDPASFTATGLGWRKDVSETSTLTGLTRFVGRADTTTETRAYSLDSLRFTQNRSPSIGGMTNVSAHFNAGVSEVDVDGYIGTAGNGWANAWSPDTGGGATLNAQVMTSSDTGYSELKTGTGNYLKMTVTNEIDPNEPGKATGGVARDYARVDEPGIDWTKEHTIQFTVRIDEDINMTPGVFGKFNTASDFYYIGDSQEERLGNNPTVTWAARVYGGAADTITADMVGDWLFYDGDRDSGATLLENQVDSNIAIELGGVYEFTIVVDPETQSYNVVLTDGETTFTANDLGWRTATNHVGGWLNFAARGNASNDVREWSIDEIIITQDTQIVVPGDTNGNGIVDEEDAAVLASNWGASGVLVDGAGDGDFNGDDVVNVLDAAILAANWGNHNPSEGSTTAPEPTGAALMLLGVLMLVARRGRVR
jgi:hypothetical protein